MQFTNTLLGLGVIAAAAGSVNAQSSETLMVTVGENGLLAFNPNNLTAQVGTVIEFDFYPKNHTVTQSSFADPCHPLDGGFFSGFVPTTDETTSKTRFSITVNDTKPIWFYCSQTKGNHCQSGMVGAINAPTTGKTLDAFVALAAKASTSTFPDGGPVGGVLSDSSSSSSSSGSSSESSSSSPSSMTSAAGTGYETSAYTSVYSSAGATYTVTATTTLFTTPAATTGSSSSSSSSSSGSVTQTSAASGLNTFNAGAMMFAFAATMLCWMH